MSALVQFFLSQPGERVKGEKWKWRRLPRRRMGKGGGASRRRLDTHTKSGLPEDALTLRVSTSATTFFSSLARFPSSWARFSYLWKDWEWGFRVCRECFLRSGRGRSHGQRARAQQLRRCAQCAVRGEKKQERGRSSSPLPAPLAAAAAAAQDTKFKSPCTDTQGLSQCDWGIAKLTSGDVARLFGILFVCLFIFALQLIDNTQPSYHYLVATVGKSSLSGVWKRR